jgi:hypothetical protein
VKGATGKILGMGEKQADLQLAPITNGTGTAAVCGEHATLLPLPRLAACIWQTLVRRIICLSIHSSTPAFHAFLCLPQSTTEVQTVMVSLMQQSVVLKCVGSEVCVDTSLCTALQLPHRYHGPCQELSAYWHIFGMHS